MTDNTELDKYPNDVIGIVETIRGNNPNPYPNQEEAEAMVNRLLLKARRSELQNVILGTKPHPGGPQNYSRLGSEPNTTLEDRIAELDEEIEA